MMTDQLKGGPSWLNKKFLETALRSAERDSYATVTSFDLTRATASGDNYLSDIFRASVQVNRGKNGESEDVSLIVKCTPLQSIVATLVSDLGIFERETQAFKLVLPELYRLLEEAAPGTYQPFAAKFLYHEDFPPTSVIVLEDLKKQGFQMAERHSGLDLNHCLLVIRNLAHLHAASVALYQKHPNYMQSFNIRIGSHDEIQRDKMDSFFSGFIRSLANEIDTWPDFKYQYSEKLRYLADNIKDKLFDAVERDDDEFNVFTHGDIWVNNTMFRYSESTNEVQDVRFVDYQLAHWTSPAIDLLHFLYTSPNPELWDKQEFLVKEYHKTLGETLQVFNLKHLHPTLQELKRHLEKRAFYSLYPAVVVLPIVLLDPTTPMKLDDIFDGDIEEGIASQGIHSSEMYKRAIKMMLPVFEAKGLF